MGDTTISNDIQTNTNNIYQIFTISTILFILCHQTAIITNYLQCLRYEQSPFGHHQQGLFMSSYLTYTSKDIGHQASRPHSRPTNTTKINNQQCGIFGSTNRAARRHESLDSIHEHNLALLTLDEQVRIVLNKLISLPVPKHQPQTKQISRKITPPSYTRLTLTAIFLATPFGRTKAAPHQTEPTPKRIHDQAFGTLTLLILVRLLFKRRVKYLLNQALQQQFSY